MSGIAAGTLRNRITIQRQIEAQASDGSLTPTWQSDYTVWASIKPSDGREKFDGQQVTAEVTHEIRIRAPSKPIPINSKHRVVFKDRIFHVSSIVNVDEMSVELILMCVEGAPDG